MRLEPAPSREALLRAIFSNDTLPDVRAAIVVAHPGDESIGTSWLAARLSENASVFALTGGNGGAVIAAAALAGIPAGRCHGFALSAGSLTEDLESLAWLVTAAVKDLAPRLLVAPACEGRDVDHDATAFAVQMAAMLLPRCGSVAPLVVEFPCHHDRREAIHQDPTAPEWQEGVRVEFGAGSKRLKKRMLRCHAQGGARLGAVDLRGETYRPCSGGEFAPYLQDLDRPYRIPHHLGKTPRTVREFRKQALAAADTLGRAGLIVARAV